MSAEKIEFEGSGGHRLAALLQMPDGPLRACALFAHCFTCSKESIAAARIAAALAAHGIAVLRFDFTGLGASEGEFANTNFSSNVADLLAGADHLRREIAAPQILIGHSLGGAAVLAAAADIPEARAVATIGAPSDARHVLRHFAAARGEIEASGEATVELAGRRFTIRRQFLDDLEEHRLHERIASLDRALFVFHAPRDEVVGIDNASAIFTAAKHPKSFVSLDDADHLLNRRADAVYVADCLAALVSRYVRQGDEAAAAGTAATAPPAGVVEVRETGAGKFQQQVRVGRHSLLADEPEGVGGLDTGPTPYDLLAAALGTCTSMTMRMYAERKGIAAGRFAVAVSHEKVHAEDCRDCGEGREGRIDRFERLITITGDVGDEARARLLEIADKCPVHRTLEEHAVIVTAEAKAADLTEI